MNKWGRASLRFVYEIWKEDKTKIFAEGMTQHALVNLDGRPVPVPDWFRQLLSACGCCG